MNSKKITSLCVKSKKSKYKTIIKNKIRDYTFKILRENQEGHTEIKHIQYNELSIQNYPKTHILNNHKSSLLFSLRSQTTREFRANFPYNSDQMCVMGFTRRITILFNFNPGNSLNL